MCGRARLSSDYSELRVRFEIPSDWPAPNFAPHWNAAPTQDLPVICFDRNLGHRRLDLMRWGLIPFWAKDVKIAYTTFNAQSETAPSKPAFREPFRKRRCLVPFDNFYEWKSAGKVKQPYAIALAERVPMALAGLWDRWTNPEGETILSFTVLTCPATPELRRLHARMPVILAEEAWPAWLGESPTTAETLTSVLAPYTGTLSIWPVTQAVGNVRNDFPALIDPVDPAVPLDAS